MLKEEVRKVFVAEDGKVFLTRSAGLESSLVLTLKEGIAKKIPDEIIKFLLDNYMQVGFAVLGILDAKEAEKMSDYLDSVRGTRPRPAPQVRAEEPVPSMGTILQIRKRKGITQNGLANMMGVSRSRMSLIESRPIPLYRNEAEGLETALEAPLSRVSLPQKASGVYNILEEVRVKRVYPSSRKSLGTGQEASEKNYLRLQPRDNPAGNNSILYYVDGSILRGDKHAYKSDVRIVRAESKYIKDNPEEDCFKIRVLNPKIKERSLFSAISSGEVIKAGTEFSIIYTGNKTLSSDLELYVNKVK